MEYLIGLPLSNKVSETTPQDDTCVLVYGHYDCTNNEISKKMPEDGLTGCFYDIGIKKDGAWELGYLGKTIRDDDDIITITHWFPLPRIEGE